MGAFKLSHQHEKKTYGILVKQLGEEDSRSRDSQNWMNTFKMRELQALNYYLHVKGCKSFKSCFFQMLLVFQERLYVQNLLADDCPDVITTWVNIVKRGSSLYVKYAHK